MQVRALLPSNQPKQNSPSRIDNQKLQASKNLSALSLIQSQKESDICKDTPVTRLKSLLGDLKAPVEAADFFPGQQQEVFQPQVIEEKKESREGRQMVRLSPDSQQRKTKLANDTLTFETQDQEMGVTAKKNQSPRPPNQEEILKNLKKEYLNDRSPEGFVQDVEADLKRFTFSHQSSQDGLKQKSQFKNAMVNQHLHSKKIQNDPKLQIMKTVITNHDSFLPQFTCQKTKQIYFQSSQTAKDLKEEEKREQKKDYTPGSGSQKTKQKSTERKRKQTSEDKFKIQQLFSQAVSDSQLQITEYKAKKLLFKNQAVTGQSIPQFPIMMDKANSGLSIHNHKINIQSAEKDVSEQGQTASLPPGEFQMMTGSQIYRSKEMIQGSSELLELQRQKYSSQLIEQQRQEGINNQVLIGQNSTDDEMKMKINSQSSQSLKYLSKKNLQTIPRKDYLADIQENGQDYQAIQQQQKTKNAFSFDNQVEAHIKTQNKVTSQISSLSEQQLNPTLPFTQVQIGKKLSGKAEMKKRVSSGNKINIEAKRDSLTFNRSGVDLSQLIPASQIGKDPVVIIVEGNNQDYADLSKHLSQPNLVPKSVKQKQIKAMKKKQRLQSQKNPRNRRKSNLVKPLSLNQSLPDSFQNDVVETLRDSQFNHNKLQTPKEATSPQNIQLEHIRQLEIGSARQKQASSLSNQTLDSPVHQMQRTPKMAENKSLKTPHGSQKAFIFNESIQEEEEEKQDQRQQEYIHQSHSREFQYYQEPESQGDQTNRTNVLFSNARQSDQLIATPITFINNRSKEEGSSIYPSVSQQMPLDAMYSSKHYGKQNNSSFRPQPSPKNKMNTSQESNFNQLVAPKYQENEEGIETQLLQGQTIIREAYEKLRRSVEVQSVGV